jgi:hypothetical protein
MKTKNIIISASILFAAMMQPSQEARATLTSVPMQGSMVHVTITFTNQTDNSLSVVIDPVTPVLTPLSISNPGESFASSDPWASVLSDSAFSRRYGFVLGSDSDTLPTGYAIAIRQTSASDGLEVYRYRTSPKEYYGIFGTDGSNDTWQWNLSMFHPTYVASAGVGEYEASYEVYVVDAATSLAVSGYDMATFTLNFTAVPEPATLVFLLVATFYRRK